MIQDFGQLRIHVIPGDVTSLCAQLLSLNPLYIGSSEAVTSRTGTAFLAPQWSIEQFLIAISSVISNTEEPESIIICTDVPQSSPITVTNLFTNADTRVTSVGLTGDRSTCCPDLEQYPVELSFPDGNVSQSATLKTFFGCGLLPFWTIPFHMPHLLAVKTGDLVFVLFCFVPPMPTPVHVLLTFRSACLRFAISDRVRYFRY